MIRVRATDGGSPPLDADVDVELDVVDRNNKPPVWQQQSYGPIYVKENAAAGTTVTSVRARFVASKRERTGLFVARMGFARYAPYLISIMVSVGENLRSKYSNEMLLISKNIPNPDHVSPLLALPSVGRQD